MEIGKEFAQFENTKDEALRESFYKRNVGEKIWFLYQYCTLTGREPELLKKIIEIKENKVTFSVHKEKVRIGKGFSCYAWKGRYYCMSIDITDEEYQEIKTWYKRIKARKDSVVVDEYINANNNASI